MSKNNAPRRRLPRRQRRLPVRRVPGARGQPARLGRALQLLLRLGLCALFSPANGSVGKEVFTFKKSFNGRRGQLQRDKGTEDRVSSKI